MTCAHDIDADCVITPATKAASATPGALSLGEREEALLMQQAVEACVALATIADEACKREGVEVACVAAVLVDLAYVQLHGAVLLRGDEPVRRRALPREVEVDNLALLV